MLSPEKTGPEPKKEAFPMEIFSDLFSNVLHFTWQQGLMILIGCLLIFLALRMKLVP